MVTMVSMVTMVTMVTMGGGHRYSWILLDTVFLDTWQIFGIQVSKYPKKTCFYAKLPDTWDS